MVDVVPGTKNRAIKEIIEGREYFTPIVSADGGGGPGEAVEVTNFDELRFLRAPIDRSGAIQEANVTRVVAPQNSERTSLVIQNISDGDLWVSEVGSADYNDPGSWYLPPGAAVRILSSGPVTVIGAQEDQRYTAIET